LDTEASDRTLTLQSRSVFIIHYTLKQNITWRDKECSTLILKNRSVNLQWLQNFGNMEVTWRGALFLFSKYYQDHKIQDEMGRACNMHEGDENALS
jgi:hypothetical protein